MSSARLLPGEQRRQVYNIPSVEEASSSSTPGRSVRSIRQRFEAETGASKSTTSSAPTTPSKKRPSNNNKSATHVHTHVHTHTPPPPPIQPKQRTQTKTQLQLAAFLAAGKERMSSSNSNTSSTNATPSSSTNPQQQQQMASTFDISGAGATHVGSLIEKWSSGATSMPRQASTSTARNPLQERHLQRAQEAAIAVAQQQALGMVVDSVDTFGSGSVDLDQFMIPKTDPGRLESYAAHAKLLAQQKQIGRRNVGQHPSTAGNQSLKQMFTREDDQPQQGDNNDDVRIRINQFMQFSQSEIYVPSNNHVNQNNQQQQSKYAIASEQSPESTNSVDHNNNDPSPSQPPSYSHHNQQQHHHNQQLPTFESSPESDITPSPGHTPPSIHGQPQNSGQSDWGAGDEYIRELFSEAEETAERAVQCDENEEYFEAFELYWVVVDLYSKVIPFLTPAEGVDVHERIKMYTRRCEAIREAFEDENEAGAHPNNEDVVELNEGNDEDRSDVVRTFSNIRITGEETIPRNPAEKAIIPPDDAIKVNNGNGRPPLIPEKRNISDHSSNDNFQTAKHHNSNSEQGEPNATGVLRRAPYPDYSERPIANIPDAPSDTRPRPTTPTQPLQPIQQQQHISASTQAHRNSLSRPISRSAARASTNSFSKEKVAEMQERVNLMQECLNNFTVKQKHLGPARALELAVTTLNANTFGDLKKLQPLAHDLEHKWAAELGVLLSMLKEIKVVRPGVGYALREDIAKHLPALERCDRSVRKTMRSFSALSGHVKYVDRETVGEGDTNSNGGGSKRKWWLKVPIVDTCGLNEGIYKLVKDAEHEMRSVFKICHEINVEVVKSIPVPVSFVESLPKHAKSIIDKELKDGLTTYGIFKIADFMKDNQIWSKENAKEITSSLEKVALIWEARTTSNKSFLSRTFDIRGERFHQAVTAFRRCQNAIRDLRREWPTMQHTDLDMAKIQNNEDIGLAGLEAYSRALESRAYRLLTRLLELLTVDERTKNKLKNSS